MGLLSSGTPLEWHEAEKHVKELKVKGVQQLVNIYNNSLEPLTKCLLWGDEVYPTIP